MDAAIHYCKLAAEWQIKDSLSLSLQSQIDWLQSCLSEPSWLVRSPNGRGSGLYAPYFNYALTGPTWNEDWKISESACIRPLFPLHTKVICSIIPQILWLLQMPAPDLLITVSIRQDFVPEECYPNCERRLAYHLKPVGGFLWQIHRRSGYLIPVALVL